MQLSEKTFIVQCPGGYGLMLSFFPGTGLYDVPPSLVKDKAKTLLSKETLQRLSDLETEIEEIQEVLLHLPATTFEQRLRRAEPEGRLAGLNDVRRAYLKAPRKEVAEELAQKARKNYCYWLDGQLSALKKSLPQTKYHSCPCFWLFGNKTSNCDLNCTFWPAATLNLSPIWLVKGTP